MAVKTLMLRLPIRAYFWLNAVAQRKGTTPEYQAQDWILKALFNDPSVDLFRNPLESELHSNPPGSEKGEADGGARSRF